MRAALLVALAGCNQVRLLTGAPGAATGHFDVLDDATSSGVLQPPSFTITN